MKSRLVVVGSLLLVTGCASRGAEIAYDDPPVAASRLAEPPRPVEIVRKVEPLPLPGQLKRITAAKADTAKPLDRVVAANVAARVEPVRAQFINAIQEFPYDEGALYQVYTAPGHVTEIVLQPGEELVERPLGAGDTARWIIGDTESGDGAAKRVHVLIKPKRPDLPVNNLVILTKRTCLSLRSACNARDLHGSSLVHLSGRRVVCVGEAQPGGRCGGTVESGLALDQLRFRYSIDGDASAWRPVRAFDDGTKVYIEFPRGIGQGEMPPLFVRGASGEAALVNYRVRDHWYVVDRLFAQAELRLGNDPQQVVRIRRTDARPSA